MRKAWKLEPTATTREAAFIFNMNYERFFVEFRNHMQDRIRWFDSSTGRRYLLIDVVRGAFPEASDQTAHYLAMQYIIYFKEQKAKRRKKRGGDQDAQ